MHSKPYKEGRSPFIFKADKEESQDNGGDDDQMDSYSDLTIRESLSRSCSLASLDELRVLAAAMDLEETQLEVPEDLQETQLEVPEESQAPETEGAPVENAMKTPSPLKEPFQGEIDKNLQRQQLSMLLNMVKQKSQSINSAELILPLNKEFFHQSSVRRFFLSTIFFVKFGHVPSIIFKKAHPVLYLTYKAKTTSKDSEEYGFGFKTQLPGMRHNFLRG